MKAKFLVPEIDTKRWAEDLKEQVRLYDLRSKNLKDISAWPNSEQRINKFKKGAIPTINSFLALCRFFKSPPDVLLRPIPKWVECEIDRSIDDICPFRILGQYEGTYYIVPNYKVYDGCAEFILEKKTRALKKSQTPLGIQTIISGGPSMTWTTAS